MYNDSDGDQISLCSHEDFNILIDNFNYDITISIEESEDPQDSFPRDAIVEEEIQI